MWKMTYFWRNINKNYTYSVQGTQLERLEHMKDLGLIFDSELNFVQHCKEKINGPAVYRIWPKLIESDPALTESINVQVQQSAQYKCKVKMIHVTRSLYLQIYPSTLCIGYLRILRFYSVFRMSVDVDGRQTSRWQTNSLTLEALAWWIKRRRSLSLIML